MALVSSPRTNIERATTLSRKRIVAWCLRRENHRGGLLVDHGAMVGRGEFGVPGMSMEQMFDFGLDRILDGIEAFSGRR